jgi:uncharacterized membrane protein YraQ (UPF0718 family)
MRLSDKKVGRFLLVVEGLGVTFVGLFLAAYLGGLLVAYVEGQPLTMVLHSEPAFRVPLFVLGGGLLFLLMTAFLPLVLMEDKTGEAT